MTCFGHGTRARARAITILSFFAVVLALVPVGERGRIARVEAQTAPYQGFGASTPGGAGQPVVRVTTLDDSGPGSLRDALAAGHRTIVFDVAGEIRLTSPLYVRGPFVTIDGASAPAPGITLRGQGLFIHGNAATVFACGSTCFGAHDVIVRGLRIRGAPNDGMRVAYGAYNVVIDHVSIHGSGDGNLDITDSHDVTVSWSILAEPALDQKNMLIKYNPARVTLHHNLFVGAKQRNPQVRIDDAGTPARDTTVDMRNNVVWDWGPGYGMIVYYGPRANVVGNFFSAPYSVLNDQNQALTVCDGGNTPSAMCDNGAAASRALAFVAGNVSGDPITLDLNAQGTASTAFAAPQVETTDACTAAHAVVAGAGAQPQDDVDQNYVGRVILSACPGAPPEPTPTPTPTPTPLPDLAVAVTAAPTSANAGGTVTVAESVTNAGTAGSPATTLRYVLSADGTVGAGDVVLGQRTVPDLPAGATSAATSTLTIPSATAGGSYALIVVVDPTGAVAEASESNNAATRPLDVTAPTATKPADLTVSALTAPSTAGGGASVAVASTVRNGGPGASGATTVRFYLSINGAADSGDVLLGSRDVPALAPGATHAATISLTIPEGTPPRTYYLLARVDADNAVVETVEGNNTRYRSLRVTAPDLIVYSLTAPTSATRGTRVSVTDTVRNQGRVPAGASTVTFYLSLNGTWDASDVALGSRGVPALGAYAMSSATTTLTIPTGIAARTYYLLARADGREVILETIETNNTRYRSLVVR